MRIVVGLLCALALTFVGCGEDQPPADLAREAVTRGLAAHRAGDVEGAREAYNEALEQEPQNKHALFNLGVIAQAENNLDEAKTRYEAAIQSDPLFAEAMFNLAIVETALDDEDAARDLYERAIAAKPGYAEAHLNLGFLLRDMGEKKRSDVELAEAVELDPSLRSRIPGEEAGEADEP